MYVSVGADLLVPASERASAERRAKAILRSNELAQAKYERDLKAYQAAKAKRQGIIDAIARDAASYQAALKSYELSARGQGTTNAAISAQYQAELAQWTERYNREYAYGQAVSQRAAAMAQATSSVLSRYGVKAPVGYPGCLTDVEKARYADLCRQQSARVTVKGLGLIQVAPSDPVCAYAELPACGAPLPPRPPTAGPKPAPPVLGKMPTKPLPPPARVVPAEPAPPRPPVLQDVPRIVVTGGGAPGVPPQKSYAVGGLLALVAVGGGTLYYLSKRKKAPS